MAEIEINDALLRELAIPPNGAAIVRTRTVPSRS